MKVKIQSVSFSLLVLSTTLSSHGQTPNRTPLTFQACVDLSKEQNFEVKAARNQLKSSEALASAAYAPFFPQLSFNLGYNHGNTTTTQNFTVLGSSASSTSSQDHTTYTANLTLNQNLFSGFQDIARTRVADHNRTASFANLQMTLARISYDLVSGFASAKYAQNMILLAESILKRRVENYRIVKLRYESGNENKGSALLAEAYMKQAEYDLLVARQAEQLAQAQLIKTLGLPLETSIAVSGEAPYSPPPIHLSLEGLSLESIPDFVQAKAQAQSAKAQVDLNQSQFWPQLNASATLGKSADRFWPEAQSRWAIGATLSWALFNGGRDYFAASSSHALWQAALSQQENLLRDLNNKLNQYKNRYIEADAKYNVDDIFTKATKVRAEISRQKYNNGLLTFESWDIIESDLIQRQKAFISSERDRTIALAQWKQILGKNVWQ